MADKKADKKAEQVLAVPAGDVVSVIDFTYPVNKDEKAVAALVKLVNDKSQYVSRDLAENDPSWKQVIPYAFLRRGPRVLRYLRSNKGGEKRLREKWSIGIGGHVNPEDGSGWKAMLNCLWREFLEETSLPRGAVDGHVLQGVLYDGSDDVGKVHLGAVFEITLGKTADICPMSGEIDTFDYKSAVDLKKMDNNFENWSRLVIKHLF